MSDYGCLSGRLTLTIAGNDIDLGQVKVPVTGFQDRGFLRLQAETATIRDAVQELFNYQEGQDA